MPEIFNHGTSTPGGDALYRKRHEHAAQTEAAEARRDTILGGWKGLGENSVGSKTEDAPGRVVARKEEDGYLSLRPINNMFARSNEKCGPACEVLQHRRFDGRLQPYQQWTCKDPLCLD